MISQKNLKKEWIFWNSYDASQLFLRKCLDQEKFVWIYIACLAGSFTDSFVCQVVTDVVSFEARTVVKRKQSVKAFCLYLTK